MLTLLEEDSPTQVLDVRTNGSIHRVFACECLLLNEPFWGEQGRLLKLFQKWLQRAENGDWLVLRWIQDQAGVMVLSCGVNLQLLPREGALRLYHQPALPSWAESEEVLVRLKGGSSQTSKMETDSFV